MKIGFIGASAGTISGGSETILYHMASALSERHEVVVYTGKGIHEDLLPHMQDAPFQTYTSFFLSRKAYLNKAITRFCRRLCGFYLRQFDVESYTLYLSMFCAPAIREALESCDVIVTIYFRDSILFSNYFSRKGVPSVFFIPGDVHLDRFFRIDRSKMYLCTSETGRMRVEARSHAKVEGVVTPGIPNSYRTCERQDVAGEQRLLFVGRLDTRKGFDELLTIYETLKAQFPRLKLTIVGDGPERPRIERRAREKNLLRDIEMTGEIPHSRVHSYYLRSTVLVHPSDLETFCIVVLEAMAFGLPVVATDLPAIREASEGEAILLSKEDLAKWVDAIRLLLEDRGAWEKISARSREVAARHVWDTKASQLEGYLQKAVVKRRPQ